MKRLLNILILITSSLAVFPQAFDFSYSRKNGETTIEFSLKDYNIDKIEANGQTFSHINLKNAISLENKGWSEVPFASTTIPLEDGNAQIEIIGSKYHEIELEFPLNPSKGSILRNQNPDSIPYTIDKKSIFDGFYPDNCIKFENPHHFREETGISLRFMPFQYNSERKILRIYDKITVKVTNTKNRSITPLKRGEYGDILVIMAEKYDSTMQPYINWKREKGFNVFVQHCDSGENVSSRIAEFYNLNRNLLYVQLVGDWNEVKSDELGTTTCQDCPTDPQLGMVLGSDNHPDLAISRFSCNNAEELAIQIEKTIKYEKNPNNNRDWREKYTGIGSAEGPGDDEELDYQHISKIYDSRLSGFTYDKHSQHYPIETNVSQNALISDINLGSSSIAYCGHGAGNYWVTGAYSGTNALASSNGDKLPFIVSVACRNGAFHSESDSFAEQWLKARHGGAITTLMSSIDQAWTPPMRGQDYFYDILSGGYNYDNDAQSSGLSNNEQLSHWGAIILNAFHLMLCESSQNSDIETVKTWTSFGDASLQLRTKTPEKITSSNNIAIENTNFSTTITAGNQNVKNALVCLSQNGNYYKGFTNSRGVATIGHNLQAGKALLVVTAFNTTTIYDSITVIPNGQAYLSIHDFSPKSM
ncbi:MAG: hypothetical protein HUK15_04090, partial [Bacteroidales bacterium]|nr:hypothetical protein [Bacteroidales bacterium]